MEVPNQVADSDDRSRLSDRAKLYAANEQAINKTSQELVISSSDGFQWCAEMDYQYNRDRSSRAPNSPKGIYENTPSNAISFTSNFDLNSSISNPRYINKNFDITLAEIDIETFKSEDFEKIRQNSYNRQLENSTDTLRIVDSMRSLNFSNGISDHLQPPSDNCEAISIDSLDLSIDNEINSTLIQKCNESDKTRYKIAMIESAHSQLQNSISSNSEYDFYSNVNNNYPLKHHNGLNLRLMDSKAENSFAPTSNITNNNNSYYDSKNVSINPELVQSPGSLVQLFIQNKNYSNENSVLENLSNNGNYLMDKCDNINYNNNLFQRQPLPNNDSVKSYTIEEIDENASTVNSLNTVDSNEIPLHVLDLNKKLRSMNLSKQLRFGSTSMSSNTSYTSTTTSSSTATFDKRRQQRYSSTNPFLPLHDDKMTKSASTQFPEMFQDKEVQASFEEEEIKEAPVLVYYPNYSLPDLSFLEDVLKQDNSSQQVYLSPVKHEPPKMVNQPKNFVNSGVNRRINNRNVNVPKKCRPKSYTDYEILLNQDFSHIKDWDSLNLLLPDDFKEFIEKNNLLNPPTSSNNAHTNLFQSNRPYPIRATISSANNRVPTVRLRSQQHRATPSNKRYSLQEPTYDLNCYDYQNYQAEMKPREMDAYMTRSQTMPNCGLPQSSNHQIPCYPRSNSSVHHQCCHACCHSNCHSPSFHSSQSSPQKPNTNFNWDLISSSNSFKKLLSFLSKLDECSSHSESTQIDTQSATTDQTGNNLNANNNINNCDRKQSHGKHSSTNINNQNRVIRRTPTNVPKDTAVNKVITPTKLEFKSRAHHSGSKHQSQSKSNLQSKATSPIAFNNKTEQNSARASSNHAEKTKIILKRPTTLNKNMTSGIPVPKRTSSKSMIPVPKANLIKEYKSKDYTKTGNTRF